MKTIIAGSRGITDQKAVDEAIAECGWKITEVVCGKAAGVDSLGEAWATAQNVSLKAFPADWHTFGRAAGFRRNADMAEYAEALILVWDGNSPGSRMMKDIARRKGLKIAETVIFPG
jgi:hypothetical protein